MSLRSQTDFITCLDKLDEQAQNFGLNSATTDFDEFLVGLIEHTPQKVDDSADSLAIAPESHEDTEGNRISYEIVYDIEGCVILLPSSTRHSFSLVDFSFQSQSDILVAGEKEKEIDEAETTHIEKNLQVEVAERAEGIFRVVAEEALEGEIEDEFAKSLSELIGQYEGSAVTEIQHFISKEKITPELAEVTLRVLGDIEHTPTYNYRRWLLEKALICSSSPIVRDGANVGLSSMDDPHSIPSLKEAIKNEKLLLLREAMEQTLVQLEKDTEKLPGISVLEGIANDVCIEFCNARDLISDLRKCINQAKDIFSNRQSLSAEYDRFDQDEYEEDGHVVIRIQVSSDQETAFKEYEAFTDWMLDNISDDNLDSFVVTVSPV